MKTQTSQRICRGELGFGFALSESKGLAAFLAPCGPKRRVETYLMDQVFPKYLERNCKAIRARYSDRYDMGTVYILEGTTHATSWCRGFTRQRGRAFHGYVSVDPIPGVPVFRVGGNHGRMVNHPVRWIVDYTVLSPSSANSSLSKCLVDDCCWA